MLDGDDMVMRTDGHFLEVDASDIYGMSVVFHCGDGDGERAFCSSFNMMSGGEDGDASPPSNNQLTDSDNDLSSLMADFSDRGSISIYASGEYGVDPNPTRTVGRKYVYHPSLFRDTLSTRFRQV